MRRILIVDDQRDVRVMLRAGLQTLGRDVSVVDVPSGEEALLVISGQPFDLLIIDVRLPGISGLELKQRAQLLNPELKLVLITGLTDAGIRQQVMDSGADAFFWKPISMAEFLDTLEVLLGPRPSPSLSRSAAEVIEPPKGSLDAPALEALKQFLLDTGAQSALIFDVQDRVLSRAGELPLLDERLLLTVMRRTVQAGASAAGPLGGVYLTHVHYFHAPGCDLYLAPLDPERFFLVTTQGGSQALPVGEMIQTIQGSLPGWRLDHRSAEPTQPAAKPAAKPANVAPEAPAEKPSEWVSAPVLRAEDIFAQPAPITDSDESLPSLVELFGEAAASSADLDANAFWDTLIEQQDEPSVRPNAISFDEAQELGLAPDEK